MTSTTALRPAYGEALWVMGGRMTVKASAQDTNGAMSIVVMEVPAGWASPLHAHAGPEYMYVLDGNAWFTIGNETVRGGPGTSVVIPGDVDEGWGADSEARLLIVSTPAGLDAVFSQFSEPASGPGFPPPPDAPPSPEAMAYMGEVAAAHGGYLRPPSQQRHPHHRRHLAVRRW
jgi:quercetin dioxygenase-like cupin family protein